MRTRPISSQTVLEIHPFLQSSVPPLNPNRCGNEFFWHPDMPHSNPNQVGISIFLNSCVPNFQHNRFGNSPFLRCRHAQFLPKLFLKFTLFCNPVCPSSIPTDVGIIFSGVRTCPVSNTSDVEILCCEIPTCPISATTDMEIQFFLKSGVPPLIENRL